MQKNKVIEVRSGGGGGTVIRRSRMERVSITADAGMNIIGAGASACAVRFCG